MSTITKLAGRVFAFFHSRAGAMMLFILSCAVCASTFSAYFERVDISVGGETHTIVTVRQDGREIIDQAGLALDNDDEFVMVVDEAADQTDIEILRAYEVTIVDAGVNSTTEIADGNVAEALAKAGAALPDENDIINYSLDETLFPFMQIVIDRVEYVDSTDTVAVTFKTIKKETDSLKKGETRIAVKGEYGEKLVTSRATYINNQLFSTEIIGETVTKNAVDEVIEVGTAVPQTTAAPTTPPTSTASGNVPSGSQFIDANGRVISYSKVLTGSATAYTASPTAKTSTGRTVQMGLVAVDPNIIPYGTNLYIVSADGKYVYGYALAADTGSAVRSGKVLVDLFYDTESQCKAFGRRDIVVYILD